VSAPDNIEVVEVEADARDDQAHARGIRAVRLGHGANCSSVGSVIDTLFLTAAAGGALLAAIAAALASEPVRVVGDRTAADGDDGDEAPS
jgi:hypothetical protein